MVPHKVRFTCDQLANLRLPGYPASRQGWDKFVKANAWKFEEFHGKGRGGIRREYLPPPEVMALIEAHLRGDSPPAKPAVAAPAKPLQPAPDPEPAPMHLYAADVPAAPYYQPPRGDVERPCAAEMRDEWLAVALRAVEDAMAATNRYVSDLNKAKIFKKVLQSVAHFGTLDGVSDQSTFEMAKLVKPLAELLVSQQPSSKPNSKDSEEFSEYERVKQRIKNEKTGAGNSAPTH